jgi:hypothetical protein
MRISSILLLVLFSNTLRAQMQKFITPFEKDSNYTATYFEVIDYYKMLDKAYRELSLIQWGLTDSGFPLHTAIISSSKIFDPVKLRSQGKYILLINNAIHPGEPEGVDASMMLVRDYLQKPELSKLLDRVVVVIIPFYNIGGGLNRGSYSRANQNGPREYGFRGNAKNLDLNRDFIKADSKNAQTFSQIFNYWKPDVFIDNHTSNGADYTYTLTMLATQEDKLGEMLGKYLRVDLLPRLYRVMANRGIEMCPYVNNFRDTPDKGIYGFYDTPRYGSGYAAMHHTLSFVPETHMLKPFAQRLRATYAFMNVMIETLYEDGSKLVRARQDEIRTTKQKKSLPLHWRIDQNIKDSILFKGYEGKLKPSLITGKDRLWYDRDVQFEKFIPYWNTMVPMLQVEKPHAYVIPQAYDDVIKRLEWNGVKLQRLSTDVAHEFEMYYIQDFKTQNAYEGHYLHYDVQVEKKVMKWQFRKGDYVVYTDQDAVRFIMETLEPQAPDSYFAWNFFDSVLGQKEYFSSYVFEDLAAELLKQDTNLAMQLDKRKANDSQFANNARAQLDFIYRNSPYYEPTHNLYPVARLVQGVNLPID